MTRHLDGKRDYGHGSVNQVIYTEAKRKRKNGRGKAQYDTSRRKGNYKEKIKKRRKEQKESKYLMLKVGFLQGRKKENMSRQKPAVQCDTL